MFVRSHVTHNPTGGELASASVVKVRRKVERLQECIFRCSCVLTKLWVGVL